MSERLAVSAVFSVLMMAIYVLFCADVPRMPLGPVAGANPGQISVDATAAELPAAELPTPELPDLDRIIPLSR